jgi:hypothetical protein
MVPVLALYKVPKLVIIVEVVSISPRRQTLELINPGLHPSSFSVSHHIDPAFCLPHETRAENFCPNTSHLPSVSGLRREQKNFRQTPQSSPKTQHSRAVHTLQKT